MTSRTELERKPPPKPLESDNMQTLNGLRVLVVEDVGMVAMSLKNMLQDMGCVVVGTAARLHEAEELVRHERLDGVLLDLNLGGQYSYPVVDILRERRIPFIIMSGYDVGQLRPDLAEAPQIQKPFAPEALEPTLLKLFRDRGQAGKTASSQSPRRQAPAAQGVPKPAMKSRGEIEAAVCQGMCQFQQEYLGRGPRDVHAHLIGELLVVRLYGVLTAAEQHLVESCAVEQGRDLLKRMRTVLIETARLQIDSMIQIITGVKVLSMHHDISTVTGEEIVIFTLSEAPTTREPKKR